MFERLELSGALEPSKQALNLQLFSHIFHFKAALLFYIFSYALNHN